MSRPWLFVTGSTGLVGSNAVSLAIAAGYRVRALVRHSDDAPLLEQMGAECVPGDVTDPPSLAAGMAGASHVLHCAAVIGGTWSTVTPEQFHAVNQVGAISVLDAAHAAGVTRTVMVSSMAVLMRGVTATETSPHLPIRPGDSPYVRAKRAAYLEGLARAARGQDIVTVIPGGIFGPAAYLERALLPTSFNSSLIKGATGELKRYLPMPLPWAFTGDVAAICLAALERGTIGANYFAAGDPRDAMSLPALCNLFNEIAGFDHRVEPFDPFAEGADADREFGTMVAFARVKAADPLFDCSQTTAELGITPTRAHDALALTAEWLRAEHRLPLGTSAMPRPATR